MHIWDRLSIPPICVEVKHYIIILLRGINPKWAILEKQFELHILCMGSPGNDIAPPRKNCLGKIRPLAIWECAIICLTIECTCKALLGTSEKEVRTRHYFKQHCLPAF